MLFDVVRGPSLRARGPKAAGGLPGSGRGGGRGARVRRSPGAVPGGTNGAGPGGADRGDPRPPRARGVRRDGARRRPAPRPGPSGSGGDEQGTFASLHRKELTVVK